MSHVVLFAYPISDKVGLFDKEHSYKTSTKVVTLLFQVAIQQRKYWRNSRLILRHVDASQNVLFQGRFIKHS